jgi:hypothetical protein
VRGFAEVRGTGSLGVDGVPWQLVERVRPEVDAPLAGDRLVLGVAVEAALAQGRDLGDELQAAIEDSDLGPLLDLAGCTWPTHQNEWLRIDSAADWLSVERLYVDAYGKAVDLRVGRQAINWGSARFFNPTDPFPEVLLTEPWRPRRGVNAVRATLPIGEQHQVQLVAASNDTFTAERAAGKLTVNVLGTDVALAGAWRGEVDEGLVGLDVRGTLGVGFWLEGAVHVRPDEQWEEVAVGVDYSFPVGETLVLTAQYYRSGRDVDSAGLAVADAIELPDCEGPAFPRAAAAGPVRPYGPRAGLWPPGRRPRGHPGRVDQRGGAAEPGRRHRVRVPDRHGPPDGRPRPLAGRAGPVRAGRPGRVQTGAPGSGPRRRRPGRHRGSDRRAHRRPDRAAAGPRGGPVRPRPRGHRDPVDSTQLLTGRC